MDGKGVAPTECLILSQHFVSVSLSSAYDSNKAFFFRQFEVQHQIGLYFQTKTNLKFETGMSYSRLNNIHTITIYVCIS